MAGSMTTMINLTASTIAMAFGFFAAASPGQAARLWASGRLEKMSPQGRLSYLRWYRAFGIILCLGGALLALDSLSVW